MLPGLANGAAVQASLRTSAFSKTLHGHSGTLVLYHKNKNAEGSGGPPVKLLLLEQPEKQSKLNSGRQLPCHPCTPATVNPGW